MIAITHLVVGFLFSILFQSFFGGNNYLFLFFVLIGSLMPDVDEPSSKFGRKIKPLSWLFKLTVGHRTFFHSLLFGFLLCILCGFVFGEVYGIAILLGFLSHLLIDGFTISGVSFFYPLSCFKMRGFIRTGGLLEKLFLLVVLIIIFIIFI